MTEYKEGSNENNKKRPRDESAEKSEANEPESKRARVDSVGNSGVSNSLEAKRIHDDLLNLLDDSDPDPAIQGLDSVIKSFEEEILVPELASVEVLSDSGESRPELGYLLEASDDELGLPPSFLSGEEQNIEAVDFKTSGSEPVNLDNMALGFEDVLPLPSYEGYNFGIGGGPEGNDNVSNDFIMLGGGLFESYEPADLSEFARRPESLSAA